MNETAKKRRRTLLLLLSALVLASCSDGGAEPPLKGAAIGGHFTLTGPNGRRASDTNFRGKYPIYYFGFTNCPDVCPTDMAKIGQALRRFEKSSPTRAARVQPFFITVDPERDSPHVLATYVEAFHPRIIGLTGTANEIAAVAKAFAIYYAKESVPGAGGYTMNHNRIAYLFGPKGEPIAILPTEKGAPAIAAELDRWVE
jgi:protein SCO1/2